MKKGIQRKHRLPIVSTALCCLAVLLGYVLYFAAGWYIGTYGDIGFDSILYTLLSDLGGVQSGLIASYLSDGLAPALLCTALTCFLLFVRSKRHIVLTLFGKVRMRLFPFSQRFSVIVSCVLAAALFISGAVQVKLPDYIYFISQQSTIFEKQFVDPNSVQITFPQEKRNLIYIFMESMETTYLSTENGGALDYDLTPELYTLAQENINFSQNDTVGGFQSVAGTGWTAAALTAQTSGITLKAPPNLASNTYGEDSFLPGVTSLNDLLKQQGYYQTLMVGSDASFGNRDQYFTQHGVDRIYDLFTARADGIVPQDRYVWWGMEDQYLYEYAKQELTEIAAGDAPFAFTMLTVDTHHIDGYKCELCGDDYDEQYENVIACASRQLGAFIEWIQAQDFYANTTVVVCGDHLTMDSGYITRNVAEDYERHVYNCVIHSTVETDNSKNRVFTAVDMFPTTLAAMGCTIEGERLGLGTNLFSQVPTLAEEWGLEQLRDELSRSSDYYVKHFMF